MQLRLTKIPKDWQEFNKYFLGPTARNRKGRGGRPKGPSYTKKYIYPKYHPLTHPEKFSYISKYILPEKIIFEPSRAQKPLKPSPNIRVSIDKQPPFFNTNSNLTLAEGELPDEGEAHFFGGHFEHNILLKWLNKEYWRKRPMLFKLTKPFGDQECYFFS